MERTHYHSKTNKNNETAVFKKLWMNRQAKRHVKTRFIVYIVLQMDLFSFEYNYLTKYVFRRLSLQLI